MPLIKPIYQKYLLDDINSGIKDILASELQTKLKDKDFQKSLRKNLDGSDKWDGKETDAEDINKALKNSEKRVKEILSQMPAPDSEEDVKIQVREITANEWSNAISASVTAWLNDEVVPAFSEVTAKVFSEVLSKVIADRTDEYLKTASLTVVLPPGTLTVGGGPAAIPNPVPIELVLDPLFALPEAVSALALKVPSGGGLK
jgi:hypothetical protein